MMSKISFLGIVVVTVFRIPNLRDFKLHCAVENVNCGRMVSSTLATVSNSTWNVIVGFLAAFILKQLKNSCTLYSFHLSKPCIVGLKTYALNTADSSLPIHPRICDSFKSMSPVDLSVLTEHFSTSLGYTSFSRVSEKNFFLEITTLLWGQEQHIDTLR
ncbi:hypothetical protein BCV71DRAFT_278278 [Rhizopus microsporus]|uniref:Uncharacterized protein n=1 Tax=Rhizopus microsporus TaxID=58291 RepID=A0A1X0RMX9_RHIZD|nr:hypothetical protein BCV71DRAFT_278278 [Rhizopus microsporus]